MALERDDRDLERPAGNRQLDPVGSEARASGNFGRRQVRVGLEVVGSDGQTVGRVKEVRDSDFLVDRSLQRDVYVPFVAIAGVIDDQIVLEVAASAVDDADWERPEGLPFG